MIRVTILSPNHALRVGLREMLSNQSGIKVLGEVVDLEDVNVKETEVLILASVSSAQLNEIQVDAFGLLLLTDDQDQARQLLDSNMRAWGVISASATDAFPATRRRPRRRISG